MDETEEAAEEIEEAPSATPVSAERLPWGCRGPRAAEGMGGMARAESPSSAAMWTKRERAGGGGEHNVEGQCDPQVGEIRACPPTARAQGRMREGDNSHQGSHIYQKDEDGTLESESAISWPWEADRKEWANLRFGTCRGHRVGSRR